MGWFSDKMFGKRKRIDQNKINDYMAPYGKMIDEQEDIARQLMDPNSLLNMSQMNMLRENQMDLLAQQQQGLQASGMIGGLSPAQIQMNQNKIANQTLGQLGNQFDQLNRANYSQGLMGLQNVMSMRQGEGERLSNMHIQEVNAANAARQSNIGNFTGLLGMGLEYFT